MISGLLRIMGLLLIVGWSVVFLAATVGAPDSEIRLYTTVTPLITSTPAPTNTPASTLPTATPPQVRVEAVEIPATKVDVTSGTSTIPGFPRLTFVSPVFGVNLQIAQDGHWAITLSCQRFLPGPCYVRTATYPEGSLQSKGEPQAWRITIDSQELIVINTGTGWAVGKKP